MSTPTRLLAGLVATVTLLASPAAAAIAAPPALPTTYWVSDRPGLATEGIAIGADGTMVVGSDATGHLFLGNVRRPELTTFAAVGTTARGTSLGIEITGGLIWSVGADQLSVHTRSGKLLQSRTVPAGPLGAADLNDLTVTDDAVYVTDWANPIVYRAERSGSRIGQFEPWIDLRQTIPGFPAQYWLLNGIVASEDGATLLVASNGTETVWRVDVASRSVTPLDVGEPSFGPDGMVLRGTTLFAVVNYGAPSGVYVAELDASLSGGIVTHRVLTDADGTLFREPTTVAVHGCRMYVVNHRDTQPAGRSEVSAVADPTC